MRPLVVIGALALVLTMAACGSSLASGGSSASPSGGAGSPAEVVRSYFQATTDKNCPLAYSKLTDPIKSSYKSPDNYCTNVNLDHLISFKVADTAQAGDTATVKVSLVRTGQTTVSSVTLLKEAGEWKISAFADLG